MSDRYQGRYRVPSSRLANWDYGGNGVYFVTICVKDMQEHSFGEVISGHMSLTALGQEAERCWVAIPEHFPFVELDEYQVMPNHIHGIVHINKVRTIQMTDKGGSEEKERQNLESIPEDMQVKNKFGPQSQNLGSIIRGFKIGVTKYARSNNLPFMWKERYYDEIVRSMKDVENVRKYIRNNPQNWQKDKLNNK